MHDLPRQRLTEEVDFEVLNVIHEKQLLGEEARVELGTELLFGHVHNLAEWCRARPFSPFKSSKLLDEPPRPKAKSEVSCRPSGSDKCLATNASATEM